MELKSPYFLLLMPLAGAWMYGWFSRAKQSCVQFPSARLAKDFSSGWKTRMHRLPQYLRLVALLLLILALAGPRKVLDQTIIHNEGIDIVLALDVSGSMSAEDFIINGQRLNRLEIIKDVVKEFIDKRVNDRIGLVVFGSRAYTVCPLTTDYTWLKSNLDRVRLGLVEDGTAIGSGIASGLIRFKNSQAKSKVMILLTDGSNNAGRIEPLTAADLAKTMGVKVYTIGAGTNGFAPMPIDFFGKKVYRNVPVEIDEESLKKIASISKGKYFRATDTTALRKIYQEIDSLEKTKIDTKSYRQYQELFWIFVLAAMGLIVLEIILTNSILFKLP